MRRHTWNYTAKSVIVWQKWTQNWVAEGARGIMCKAEYLSTTVLLFHIRFDPLKLPRDPLKVVAYNTRQWEPCGYSQKRKRNFMNIIPSTCFKQYLLTVKPKQSQSQSIHFPGIASCLHLSNGGKTTVFETYLVQWNVGQSSWHDSCLGTDPRDRDACALEWAGLS